MLHWAAAKWQVSEVQLLLEEGTDNKAETSNRWTALHMAARMGCKTVMQLLSRRRLTLMQWIPLDRWR